MPFQSINPATGEAKAAIAALAPHEVLSRIESSDKAFKTWSQQLAVNRYQALAAWARAIRAEAEGLAKLATWEMGKPISQSRVEVEKCAATLEYIAGHAAAWLAPEKRRDKAQVHFEPLGVLVGVMPWNFPYWQIVRFACGAMAAGNAVLIKPAPNTPETAIALEKTAQRVGLPLEVLLAETSDLEIAVAHDAVQGVSLTGSTRAGRAFASLAAKYGKPAVLELGGSDPFVVLADGDVNAAAKQAAAARTLASGQSCIAAKRFIAVEEVYEPFKAAFVAEMRALKVGDPLDDTTDVGPMARKDLLEGLVSQRDRALVAGATPLLNLPSLGGNYFVPEILELSKPEGPAWSEETFGPLAALVRARGMEHAVELANATPYGLGASVWTKDPSIAARIQAGNVFFNSITRSDGAVPFGGVKASGYGRELGVEGVRQFTNVKTVWME